MKLDLYKKEYDRLNDKQKEAVDTIEGPVMVIAGPGTGKTTILTLRIANILRKTDTPPDGILALTFTDSAASSMRKKLVPLIGSAAYRVNISTFHSFAEDVIKRHPESFPRIIGSTVASEAEKLSIIEFIISAEEFEYLKPFGAPLHFVRSSLSAISELKREAVTPEDFLVALDKEEQLIFSSADLKHQKGKYKGEVKSVYKTALKNASKNRELARIYKRYEELITERKLYDFDDMLLELLFALRSRNDLLQILQEEFLYFLADEHQDANNAQNAILELLSGYFDNPNLFIVGDEKQAIYRFQGASLENFLYFKNKFPLAKIIFLDSNYRSKQNILDASHELIVNVTGDVALRHRLKAHKEGEGRIEIIEFQSEQEENSQLALLVRREIEKGLLPSEIAVLVRTNREIPEIGMSFLANNIPVTLFHDDDILSDSDMGKFLILLNALVRPTEDELVAEALFIDFLELDPIDAIEFIDKARKSRFSILKTIKSSDFGKNFSRWVMLVKNRSALEAFNTIITESKFVENLLKNQSALEKMSLLSALYEEVVLRQAHAPHFKLKDFLEDIRVLKEHGARLNFASRLPKENTVSVMTAHRSKGLEWQAVFVPHVVAGVWGSRRTIRDFSLPDPFGSAHLSGKEEDERRLFYVVLTRAKEKVVFTYSKIGQDGKDKILSQFVEELPKSRIAKIVAPHERTNRVLSASRAEKFKKHTLWDREYLGERFIDQGLNATALNNYLECPWKYFFRNLVRIPSVQSKHQMYGTALHVALAFYSNSLREGEILSLGELSDGFEKALAREPLSDADFKESLVKGKRALTALYPQELKNWEGSTRAEFNISGVFLPSTGDLDNILLRGRLDKVDEISEGEVRVTDFKTGRAKSRQTILGETRNSIGAEKRQLDFYRLLLDLFDGGKYKMTAGVILFTEPDEKNRIRKEEFEMSEIDSDKIAEEVRQVAREIIKFEFWDRICEKRDCEYCALRRTLFI